MRGDRPLTQHRQFERSTAATHGNREIEQLCCAVQLSRMPATRGAPEIGRISMVKNSFINPAATNMLTESGVAPGLESLMKGYAAPEAEEPVDDDRAAEGVMDARGHYDPSQPRASAGSENGGQWVKGGGGTGEDDEMPEEPEGHERFFHGSPESDLREVEDRGMFGGVFAGAGANSHVGRDGALYYADIPEDAILTHQALNYDINYDDQVAALRKSMPRLSDDDLDLAYEVVIEQKDVWGRDWDDVERVFGGDDFGEASWEGQRIRGQVAKRLGYKAVEMDDEHGTSWLLLPGVKLKSVPGGG